MFNPRTLLACWLACLLAGWLACLLLMMSHHWHICKRAFDFMTESRGYITPEIAGKFPGYLSPSAGLKFADVPNGLAAISKAV